MMKIVKARKIGGCTVMTLPTELCLQAGIVEGTQITLFSQGRGFLGVPNYDVNITSKKEKGT